MIEFLKKCWEKFVCSHTVKTTYLLWKYPDPTVPRQHKVVHCTKCNYIFSDEFVEDKNLPKEWFVDLT